MTSPVGGCDCHCGPSSFMMYPPFITCALGLEGVVTLFTCGALPITGTVVGLGDITPLTRGMS